MRPSRLALVTPTVLAAAALAPALAHAVPPTLGAPTNVPAPSQGTAPPASAPAPPPPPAATGAAPASVPAVQEPPQQTAPIGPAAVSTPAPKLLLTPAVRLTGSSFTLRLRCSGPGTAGVRVTGPGSVTGLRLGSLGFACRAGRGTLKVRLGAAALRRVGRVSAFTVEVAARAGGETRRGTALVNRPARRRATGAKAAFQTWNTGHGSCGSSGDPYQSGKFTVYVPNFTTAPGHADWLGWRAWILVYTDAGGYHWETSGWYYWHLIFPDGFRDGPHSHSFWIRAGQDMYIQGAVEYYRYYGETGDWNYVETKSNWGAPTYGSWCYYP